MDVASEAQVRLQYTVTEDDLSFTDAFYLTFDEYAKRDEKAVLAAQQERFEAWKVLRSQPPEKVAPEKELADVQEALTVLLARKVELLELVAIPADAAVEVPVGGLKGGTK